MSPGLSPVRKEIVVGHGDRSRGGSLSFGVVNELFGVACDHHSAEGQGHDLGNLLWGEHFSFSRGVLVVAPVIVGGLVVGWSEGR